MSLATRVLAGLLAGFGLGLALAAAPAPWTAAVVAGAAAIGGMFVDLIRMTAMPLVVSLVIAGIGAATAGGVGRAGLRATGLALALLVAASAGSLAVALPVLRTVTPDAGAVAAVGASPAAPSLLQWVRDLVPANVVKAAADGAMLPVIVFAVLFGLALARVRADRREAVVRVVEGVGDTMQQLVGWLLGLAPLGVFALAVPLAARLGLGGAGAVATYVVLVVALTIVATALLYPVAAVVGRLPLGRFAAYCAPAQSLAFASRSSLATLPAMVEAAERAGFPRAASRLVMPLAVSVFHYGSAVAQTVGVVFLARLAGVELTAAGLATIVVTVVVASSAVPGIPGGSIIAIVPVLSAANVPLEGIGLLLAADAVPDMFRTTANVTGAMALTAMLRDEGGPRRPPD